MKPLLLTILASCIAFSSLAGIELSGIQAKIDQAQTEAFKTQDTEAIDAIIESLEDTDNPSGTHLADYWTAYAYYQKAVYHAFGEKSEKEAMAAIKAGKKIIIDLGASRNSEDFALLTNLQSISLQYVQGMKIMAESGAAEDWAEMAMQAGPNNPRAFFVAGQYDFYKPAFVGGGKKAEKLLTKALELYKEEIVNPALPSWGFADTYAILAQMHAEKQPEKAAVLVAEGLERFPDHYGLLEVQQELSK
ncbi:MAG: hypothetical protein KTR13_04545 [Saprospiraceae bacterium]|nr:hypothetical protein [Saprospiraceae bacterium]